MFITPQKRNHFKKFAMYFITLVCFISGTYKLFSLEKTYFTNKRYRMLIRNYEVVHFITFKIVLIYMTIQDIFTFPYQLLA